MSIFWWIWIVTAVEAYLGMKYIVPEGGGFFYGFMLTYFIFWPVVFILVKFWSWLL